MTACIGRRLHKSNSAITFLVYFAVIGITVAIIIYMTTVLTDPNLWIITATVQVRRRPHGRRRMLVAMALGHGLAHRPCSCSWSRCLSFAQDTTIPTYAEDTKVRVKDRGTAASMLSATTFSLAVNAALDKFGQIDPSTSTVFIGMTL